MINIEILLNLIKDICKKNYLNENNYSIRWDYRSDDYPGNSKVDKHPNDLSVQTFVSHKVLRTLIRCRFSPETTTGKKLPLDNK